MVKVGRARRRTATAASVEEPLAASASATAAATPVASAPIDSDGGAGGRSERPASKKGPRAASPRPNYFLSLRVNNQAIWDRAAVCQAKLLEKEPGLSRCIIPPNTMHLTLFVIHLADEAAVERARQLLVSNTVVYTPVHGHIPKHVFGRRGTADFCCHWLPPPLQVLLGLAAMSVHFRGLGCFGSGVVSVRAPPLLEQWVH
jgi:hypothetical protein